MAKLIANFERTGSLKDAHKLIDYVERHPMATVMLDTYQMTWIEVAKEMTGR